MFERQKISALYRKGSFLREYIGIARRGTTGDRWIAFGVGYTWVAVYLYNNIVTHKSAYNIIMLYIGIIIIRVTAGARRHNTQCIILSFRYASGPGYSVRREIDMCWSAFFSHVSQPAACRTSHTKSMYIMYRGNRVHVCTHYAAVIVVATARLSSYTSYRSIIATIRVEYTTTCTQILL